MFFFLYHKLKLHGLHSASTILIHAITIAQRVWLCVCVSLYVCVSLCVCLGQVCESYVQIFLTQKHYASGSQNNNNNNNKVSAFCTLLQIKQAKNKLDFWLEVADRVTL